MIKHTIYTNGFNGPYMDSTVEFIQQNGRPYFVRHDNEQAALISIETLREVTDMNVVTIYIAE